MLSYESTWKEIEEARPDGAVIGIGANEQHGPHLPLNMDCLSAEYLARGVAEAFDWYQLPTLPIGASAEHMGFAGTLTLRSETLIAVFTDIVDCLERHGITKLAIVSGHGGNWFLKMMTRELNYENLGVTIFLVNTDRWFYPVLQELTQDQTLHHAGELETSVVMYLRPDLVKPVEVPDDSPDYPSRRDAYKKGRFLWHLRVDKVIRKQARTDCHASRVHDPGWDCSQCDAGRINVVFEHCRVKCDGYAHSDTGNCTAILKNVSHDADL